MMPRPIETKLSADLDPTYPVAMSRFRARPPASSPTGGSTTYSGRTLARLLDDLFRVPGTDFRYGFDVLIGLIPGVGDAAGSVIASVILIDAVRHRVPLPVLARMGWNVILDALLGLVPAVGDLADAAHRANVKNLRLLERTLAEGRTVDVSSRTYLVRAILMVVVILAIAVAVTVFAIWAVLRVLHIV